MTHTHTTAKSKTFLFVEVPSGSYHHCVYNNDNKVPTMDYFKFMTTSVGEIELPAGIYTSEPHLANKLLEEQWRFIVDIICVGTIEKPSFRWRDYSGITAGFLTAKESGMSLLASLNMKPDIIVIIEMK